MNLFTTNVQITDRGFDTVDVKSDYTALPDYSCHLNNRKRTFCLLSSPELHIKI